MEGANTAAKAAGKKHRVAGLAAPARGALAANGAALPPPPSSDSNASSSAVFTNPPSERLLAAAAAASGNSTADQGGVANQADRIISA
ncbi:hypothetical protein HK405_015012 [Cladochytrium tenue]|nr:hypothetical protein HK405_015012 [Cladochytrium tenue]